jgi:AraC-like DNA-binding protein
MEHTATTIYNYSDVFFSYYFNDEVRCHKMIEDHTLAYVMSGEILVEKEGSITRVGKGQCMFVRRDNRVNWTKQPCDGEQFQAIFMVFRRNLLREFYRSIEKKDIPIVNDKFGRSFMQLPKTPGIESLFQSMRPYFDAAVKPTEQVIKLKQYEGIYALLAIDKYFFSCLFDFAEPWKIDILDFLENNYMFDFSLEDMANYTGRSLATFKRDFGKVSHLSPQKWLTEKRLRVAREKIQNHNARVSEVYLEVGFKNLSHFSTAYKKQFGFAPTH